MSNQAAAVIPFPGALPTRSVLYCRTRAARRVEVLDECLNGQHRYWVVVTNIFTDAVTLTGPLFDKWEALAMAHTGGM